MVTRAMLTGIQVTSKSDSESGRISAARRTAPLRSVVYAICALWLVAATPYTHAGELDEPTALAMAGDLVIARPAGIILTVLGSAAFVLSLPFSAGGGNISEAAETLVVGPARATFVRCLGCTTSGYKKNNDE